VGGIVRERVTITQSKTGHLRAVRLPLGHTKMDSTVRYLGVDLEDALAIAESIALWARLPGGGLWKSAGPRKFATERGTGDEERPISAIRDACRECRKTAAATDPACPEDGSRVPPAPGVSRPRRSPDRGVRLQSRRGAAPGAMA
jgi:hypothetical protein